MLLLTLALFATSALAARDYTGHKVIRAIPTHEDHLNVLAGFKQYDFWKEPTALERNVDIRVSPEDFPKLKTSLRHSRIPFEVLHEDVQALIDESMRPSSAPDKMDFTDYKTFDEITEFLTRKQSECGPRCSIETIGNSYEGRPLRVFKVSTGAPRRALWIDCGIHAREWIAWSTGLYFIERFVDDFGVDPELDTILATYDIYLLAGQNPDGYVYTWTDERLWRKSRQPHPVSPCVGADINRNFDFQWSTVGASDQPCDDTYCGQFAESEPEAEHVAAYVPTIPDLDLFMTLHTYGQLWMAPWGYTTELPPDYDELMRVADAGAAAIFATHGNRFETGSASEILYQSSGTSRDWARGVPNIDYVYTLELRNENSFVLPPEEILPAGEETWAGFKAAIDAIMAGP